MIWLFKERMQQLRIILIFETIILLRNLCTGKFTFQVLTLHILLSLDKPSFNCLIKLQFAVLLFIQMKYVWIIWSYFQIFNLYLIYTAAWKDEKLINLICSEELDIITIIYWKMCTNNRWLLVLSLCPQIPAEFTS